MTGVSGELDAVAGMDLAGDSDLSVILTDCEGVTVCLAGGVEFSKSDAVGN